MVATTVGKCAANNIIKSSGAVRAISVATRPKQNEVKIDIKTEIPGPRSRQLWKELNSYQEMSSVTLFSDLDRSIGNFLADVDGNMYLDCFMQIASIPLGYNHPAILKELQDPSNLAKLANRPAMGWFPNEDWVKQMTDTFMSIAPKGLDQIYPMMCGTCSNENAMKLSFMRHMQKSRGDRVEFTKEEMESTMTNSSPGSPELSMLAFKGGFHGRTIGLLSCSNSRPIHGVDIPTMKWPKAEFPRYLYPLHEYERENKAEDDRCLDTVREAIFKQAKVGAPVVGMITEPIQAEGGDYHGSKYFFQGLEKISKEHDISLIIDEVQTGGGSTGKMWCHEHFDLEDGPDIVTFSKKLLSGGIFHKKSHRPPHPGRIINTWVGDPHKIVLLSGVLKVMRQQNLLRLVNASGDVMLSGLTNLEHKYPGIINASRGLGTFIAFDCPSTAVRDKVIVEMRSNGVIIGGCGDKTVRLRPSLTFEPEHAHQMLDTFDVVFEKLNK